MLERISEYFVAKLFTVMQSGPLPQLVWDEFCNILFPSSYPFDVLLIHFLSFDMLVRPVVLYLYHQKLLVRLSIMQTQI